MISIKPAGYETKLLMDMRPNFGFKDVWDPSAWRRIYDILCDDAPPMLLIHYCHHGKVMIDLESIFECVGNPNHASSIECAPLFGIWVEEDLSNLNMASLIEVFIQDR
jgi:hypothetical protein